MTSISKYREDVIAQSSQSQVTDIEARLSKVLTALEKKNSGCHDIDPRVAGRNIGEVFATL